LDGLAVQIFGFVRDMTAKDIATFLIAGYGAILSTFVFLRSVTRDRRKVFLRLSKGARGLNCEIVNRGTRAVVINQPKLRLPDGRLLPIHHTHSWLNFPKQLADGEQVICDLGPDEKGIAEAGYSGNVTVRAICSDTGGKQYKSSKYKYVV
jgi:hypothetical protein